MPACSRQKNPRGVEIVFTEGDHKYTSVIDGHYSLQLNLYDRLLHEAGYCPKDEKIKKAILHIQPNGHKTYVIKDMSEEIDRLLAAGAIPNQR